MDITNDNYLRELFINEATPALSRHSGGGSAAMVVDDGYVITWDGNTEGLDKFTFSVFTLYKVSELVLDEEKISNAFCRLKYNDATQETPLSAVSVSGAVAGVGSDGAVYAVSAKAGDYPYDDITVSIPSDGTYFVYVSGAIAVWVSELMKPGTGETIPANDAAAELQAKVNELETWKSENEFGASVFEERLKTSNWSYLFRGCSSITKVPELDSSNVVSMVDLFSNCTNLTTVPQLDTRNVLSMVEMFASCRCLITVPEFDTSKVTNMNYMFSLCIGLQTVPKFDTSKVTSMTNMFDNCVALATVPEFDMRQSNNVRNMFNYCQSLMTCLIRNIKVDIQVGSGTSWGHLLTLDSLIHLVYECRDTGSMKTLTVGTANLEKLANVYVKIIEITDAMRAEDDLIDEKLPFEVCESTDEGAMLISNYVLEKNWQIK